jgi:hypothetical protein
MGEREFVAAGVWRKQQFAGLAAGLIAFLLLTPGEVLATRPRPIVFEANRGQTDAQVKFLARGPGFTLFVTASEAVLVHGGTGQVVRLQLLGAREASEVVGLEPLPGRSHYFRGPNPARWVTNVPTYSRVALREAYPGIDAVYKASAGAQIEQEFIVRPGADAAAIALQFDGIHAATVDETGDLVLATPAAPLRLSRPIAYQEIGGTRREIPVAWIVRGPRRAGFELGTYDRSLPLVIDPLVVWSTRLGGSGDDQAFGVAVDGFGHIVVTGDTGSVDFPTLGPPPLAGGVDAFVTKLDRHGRSMLYSAYIGGTGTDGGRAIAVDWGVGDAYLAGFTNSTDFPTTSGAFQELPQGDFDAFVIKLNPDGILEYSTLIGGLAADMAFGIAVDSSGRAHVAGGTRSSNFPVNNALQPLPGGGRDAFVARVSALGDLLEYSTFLGGSDDDNAYAIAVDFSGNAYVTGFTLSSDFPTTPGSLQPLPGGESDAFVARIDADATLGWATFLGGLGTDVANGIAVDGNVGTSYVVGSTTSTNFPLSGGGFTGLTEGFVTRLDATGRAIVWSRSTGSAVPTAVAMDLADVYLVANQVMCTDPSLVPPGCPQSHVDVVVNKLSESGIILGLFQIGGTGDLTTGQDFGQAIAAFNGDDWTGEEDILNGSVFVAGFTASTNFPTTAGTVQTSPQGGTDAFVVRLDGFAFGASVNNNGGNGGDSCVIATAAFGSPLASEVQTLRRFRDRVLMTNAAGRLLVLVYYRTSPPLARIVAREPILAATVRGVLRPVARGAGFTLDQPLAAVGLVSFGSLVIVGLLAKTRRSIAFLVVGVALLGGALALGVWDRQPPAADSSASAPPPSTAGRDVSVPRPLAGRPVPSAQESAQRIWDLPLVGGQASVTLLNPFAPPAERRWAVTSTMIEGVLSVDGFVVTNALRARSFGIRDGDTIVRVDGHPPTGLLAVILPLQRDPDRATVVVEIDRGSNRIVQSYRVR